MIKLPILDHPFRHVLFANKKRLQVLGISLPPGYVLTDRFGFQKAGRHGGRVGVP